MTFEEYKRKKEKAEPRSWFITVSMGAVTILSAAGTWAFVQNIIYIGLDPINVFGLVAVAAITLYAAISALDGKRKTAREAMYDIFLFWPYI